MLDKVTVITVTYNIVKEGREDFLRQCLESVHNQSYSNIEHIVIDGASTDGSLEVLREYERKKWIKFYSEKDNGMVDAMNKGIRKAEGEYIAILNSDDWYEKNAIETLVTRIKEESADYSWGMTSMLSRDGKKKIREMGEKSVFPFFFYIPFNHEAMLCRKKVYEELNYYDWKTYDTIADFDFVQRMILSDYKGVYVDNFVLNFRMDGTTNVSDDAKVNEKYQKHLSYLSKLYKTFFFRVCPERLHEQLIRTFSMREHYLTEEEVSFIYSDQVLFYLIKYLSEKNLKNFPYDDLFNFLMFMRNRFNERQKATIEHAEAKDANCDASKIYIKVLGIPFLKITNKFI